MLNCCWLDLTSVKLIKGILNIGARNVENYPIITHVWVVEPFVARLNCVFNVFTVKDLLSEVKLGAIKVISIPRLLFNLMHG